MTACLALRRPKPRRLRRGSLLDFTFSLSTSVSNISGSGLQYPTSAEFTTISNALEILCRSSMRFRKDQLLVKAATCMQDRLCVKLKGVAFWSTI